MRRADLPTDDRGATTLLVGIDEAGYGPRLGPLVVAGAAFRVGGGSTRLPDDLLARPGEPARGRLVVGDSKELYGPSKDLRRLERPVLAFASAAGGPMRDLDDLLVAVGVAPAERRAAPWYASAPPALPQRAERAEVDAAAAGLRAALAEAGVEFVGFAAVVLAETRLNEAVALSHNKADVLFDASAHVLDRLLERRRSGEAADAVLDRHGGRRFYLRPLASRWPQRFPWALEETPTSSRYRLALGDADAHLRFEVEADRRAPHVGLASMLAKYLRESFMGLWNGYFAALCPGVAATAGYAEDARRWLAESRAARLAAGVEDEKIVRVR